MKLVAISDTHNKHDQIVIPECDILIHAGDFSFHGSAWELENFAKWLERQPAKHIVMTPGNHEEEWEKNWLEGEKIIKHYCPRVHILNDSGVGINGLTIWGSPVTPWFYDWGWNRARDPGLVNIHGKFIGDHWDLMPETLDILITHGPPQGILDTVLDLRRDTIDNVGCEHLMEAVRRVKPKLHFFGHIHQAYGEFHKDGTSFYNASICNEFYRPEHKPIEINLGEIFEQDKSESSNILTQNDNEGPVSTDEEGTPISDGISPVPED